MNELIQVSVIVGILTSAIRLATPYLYAAIGETFAQNSGVLNLGAEGVMSSAPAASGAPSARSSGRCSLGSILAPNPAAYRQPSSRRE